ncbi:pseudouridine synthase [Olsenella massiliensis]|uniref:pseudouridine synthase n=1 Tax=Olsenella massiliensis TaxID=1622075 RepID=UPI00071E60A6|nr:pseudouridine synthase [Olsenella massiliensis]
MPTTEREGYPRTMRLQRFLARAGVASRRGAEGLMTAGRVSVNGVVTSKLGSKVDADRDEVTVDGRVVRLDDEHSYLMLYKPAGYVTTMSDPQGRPCVAQLVPTDRLPGLFPVGRLDADTTGLLLFTTNGDLGNLMLRPASHVWKHYVALVRGSLGNEAVRRLREGVALQDDRAQPARVELLGADDARARPVVAQGVPRGTSVVGITVHEGKKHQVKRMLKAVGHEVVRLHRDAFGPLRLTGLRPGQLRGLDPGERAAVEGLMRDVAHKGGAHDATS